MRPKGKARGFHILQGRGSRRLLLRALMNVRMPQPVSDQFLEIQDDYLACCLQECSVQKPFAVPLNAENLGVSRGDITTLETGAIVNAANDQMLGYFILNRHCISTMRFKPMQAWGSGTNATS